MKKVASLFALALAGSACLVLADGAGEAALGEPEPVAESSAALTTADPTAGGPDASKWMSRNVPIWNAYVGGLGKDARRNHPDDNDLYAPIVFVRAGDEATPEKWLELRLWYHWMMGDAYLEKLVGCGLVSPLDLLSMRAAIQDHKDQKPRLPSIFTLPAATPDAVLALDQRSRSVCPGKVFRPFTTFYEERGDFNPFPGIIPGPNNEHTGPGPSAASDGSRPPKGVTPPKGEPSRNDPPQTSLHHQKNGVFRGDPKPIPFSNPNYEPTPGEREETFRCGGVIYRGFKRGCVDFANDFTASKWEQKIAVFARKNGDAIHRWIFHHVWHDGKNPECTVACNNISNAACYGIGGALFVVCIGATDGLCASGAAGAASGTVLGGLAPAQCVDQVRGYCAKNICLW